MISQRQKSSRDFLVSGTLKSHRVVEVGTVPANRNHGEDVHKGRAVLPEIGNLELQLDVPVDALAHASQQVAIDVSSRRARGDIAARGLQEATVAAENFVMRIARKLIEGLRGIDDRLIRLLQIAEDEGTRRVDSPNMDKRVWASRNTNLRERQSSY